MAVGEFNHEGQAVSEERTCSVQKITDILQIGRSMAYNLCKRSLSKAVKAGKYVRVSKPPFNEWLDT